MKNKTNLQRAKVIIRIMGRGYQPAGIDYAYVQDLSTGSIEEWEGVGGNWRVQPKEPGTMRQILFLPGRYETQRHTVESIEDMLDQNDRLNDL